MFGLGVGILVAVGNKYQPARIAKRERTQQQRIDHAEYGGTGADAEAGDENRNAVNPASRRMPRNAWRKSCVRSLIQRAIQVVRASSDFCVILPNFL